LLNEGLESRESSFQFVSADGKEFDTESTVAFRLYGSNEISIGIGYGDRRPRDRRSGIVSDSSHHGGGGYLRKQNRCTQRYDDTQSQTAQKKATIRRLKPKEFAGSAHSTSPFIHSTRDHNKCGHVVPQCETPFRFLIGHKKNLAIAKFPAVPNDFLTTTLRL
jgi:hypothetical protein